MRILTYETASLLRKYDYLTLGPTPHDEECIQCGSCDVAYSKLESMVYATQLERMFGTPPPSTEFFIMKNYHDFGVYYEAAILFNPDDETSSDYAFGTEEGCNEWDAESLKELIILEHPKYTGKVIRMKKAS